jgi:hypothetical protein
MSIFEPSVVISVLQNSKLVPQKERTKFSKDWNNAVSDMFRNRVCVGDVQNEKVDTRVNSWIKHRSAGSRHQSTRIEQLRWEAHVVEYVNILYRNTKKHGNSKKNTPAPCLPQDVPLLGPRFIPPTYLHLKKRQGNIVAQPETAYLKPLNIIHPFYYDSISKCPQCDSLEIYWDGWTTTGHRELHGIQEEETALGYQLVCKRCCEDHSAKSNNGLKDDEGSFCFATTNPTFWRKWEHWAVPR